MLDLCWRPYDFEIVRETVLDYKPDIVGITATTPLMNQVRDISVLVKDISKNIAVVSGGPHVSALPTESICESIFAILFCAENRHNKKLIKRNLKP